MLRARRSLSPVLQIDESATPEQDRKGSIVGATVGCGWFPIRTGTTDTQVLSELVRVEAPSRIAVQVDPAAKFTRDLLAGHVRLVGAPNARDRRANQSAAIVPGPAPHGHQSRTCGKFTAEQAAQVDKTLTRWQFAK